MYRVVVTSEAAKDLQGLDAAILDRLLDKLQWLGDNAELIRHAALQGDEWAECYKYRMGDYRIVYQVSHADQLLTVLKVGHRREVYR